MCEYCENEKPIIDEFDKKVQIFENTMLVRRSAGNVFNLITCNTVFDINFCPMCGRNLKGADNI